MRNKLKITLTATVMSIVMFMLSIPQILWVKAVEGISELEFVTKREQKVDDIPALADNVNFEDLEIIEEDEVKRTLNSKEYLLNNGMRLVEQYPYNVHYIEDGVYKEIDNTLVLKKGQDKTYLENASNSMKVRFEHTSKIAGVEIDEADASISISPIIDQNAQTQIKIDGLEALTQATAIETEKSITLETNKVKYESFNDKTDLEYVVNNNGVQKNIIVNAQKSEYVYKFELTTNGLTLEKSLDGNIIAFDSNGNARYIIPQAVMTDKDGKESPAVVYALDYSLGRYILTVTADADWINSTASLPVKITPKLERVEYSGFKQVLVSENIENKNISASAQIGKQNALKQNTYVQFELGKKSSAYELLYTKLDFAYTVKGAITTTNSAKYSVSLVENTENLQSITYEKPLTAVANKTTYTVSASHTNNAQKNSYVFDASAIKDGKATFAFTLEQQISDGAYAVLDTTSARLISVYTETYGIDDKYDYEKIEMDGVQVYVNQDTHKTSTNLDLFTLNENSQMPLDLSLVFNQDYEYAFSELITPTESSGVALGEVKMFGNNVKLNFQQYLRNDLNNNAIYHYDADGSVNPYYWSRGAKYIQKVGTTMLSANGSALSIFDESGNSLSFTKDKLTRIENVDNSSIGVIQIEYLSNTGKISTITKTVNKNTYFDVYQVIFTYGDNGYVSSAKGYKNYSSIIEYTFEYDLSGNLTKVINNSANEKVYSFSYAHSTTNAIIFLHNRQNEDIYYSYNSTKSAIGITTYSGFAQGTVYFAKPDENTRTVRYSVADQPTEPIKTSVFNDNRELISQWLEDGDDVSLYSPGLWLNPDGTVYNFNPNQPLSNFSEQKFKTDYVEDIDTNTTLGSGGNIVGAGVTLTGNVVARATDKEYNDLYRYGLTFKLSGTGDKNVLVNVNNQNSRTISVTTAEDIYVTVPCGYLQPNTTDFFSIKNNGANSVTVSNVTYGEIEYFKEKRSLRGIIFYVSQTESIDAEGNRTIQNYDDEQVLLSEQYNTVMGVNEQTTYTQTTENNQAVSITTKTRNGETVSTLKQTFNANGELAKEEQTQGSVKTLTTYAYDNNVTYNKTTVFESGQPAKVYTYSVNGGDFRLTSYECANVKETYEYNYFGELIDKSVYNVTASAQTLAYRQQIEYTNGRITSINYGYDAEQAEYLYSFDLTHSGDDRVTEVKHNGTTMVTNTYTNSLLTQKTYANGNVATFSYDQTTKDLLSIGYKNSASDSEFTDEYLFTMNGDSLSSVSHARGENTLLTYTYNDNDDGTQSLTISGFGDNLTYTTNLDSIVGNELTKSATVSVGDETHNITQKYNSIGQFTQYGFSNYNVSYTYDSANRISNRIAKVGENIRTNKTYQYETVTIDGVAYSTGRVSAIVDNVDASRTQTLTYDDRGNITQLNIGSSVASTYAYDNQNRVISDSAFYNQWFNTYTYNEKYNAIASKYSSNVMNYGPEPVSTEYTYNNLGQLIVMTENGVNKYFAYDALGNPTKYKTSSPTAQDNLVWTQGRYLTSGTLNGNTFSYEYDASGTRYKKTVNGQTTEFYISNGRILAQRTVDFLMGNLIDYYFYDSTGVIGMYYAANGEYFTFEKNALGDVVRVLDSLGNEMAWYDYDAWGNVIGEGGVAAHIFAFRYRGYYYDAETGFYYLQSRYYDPSTMRFINADDYELAETLMADPGQLYIYNYCNNNPVMYTDPSGRFFISLTVLGLIIGVTIGAVIGGVVAYNTASASGAEGWELVAWTLLGILGGGAIGAAVGAGVGALVSNLTGVLGFSVTKYSVLTIKSTTVLGNMPGYISAATTTNSGYYLISESLYASMTPTQQWANNLQYIKDAITAGSRFCVAPDRVVGITSTLWKELQYLIQSGIAWQLF